MKKILLPLMAAMALMSCKKEKATASFNFAKPNYYLTEPVIFTNNSSNASKYDWDFGDGQVSSDPNPNHAYTTAGNYQIKLTVNGENTTTKNIRIFPGTASYEVNNSTGVALPMMSFYVDANNQVVDFQDHGTIAVNGKSDTIFTNRSNIYVGGQIGTQVFWVVNPYTINKYMHNKPALLNSSIIHVSTAVNGQQVQSVKQSPSTNHLLQDATK